MGFYKWSFRDKFVAIWALSIATVALLFVCVSVSNLIIENSANIASWLQAIVAMAAIIAGALGLNWQVRVSHQLQKAKEEESSRKEMRRQYLVLAYKLSELSSFGGTIVNTESDWADDWVTMRLRCQQVRNELNNFNVSDFPTPFIIGQMIVLKSHLNAIQIFLDAEMPDFGDGEYEDFKEEAVNFSNVSNKQCLYFYRRSVELSTNSEKAEEQANLRDLRETSQHQR